RSKDDEPRRALCTQPVPSPHRKEEPMSRGLGAMQSDILQVYDTALTAPPIPGTGRDDWRYYDWLREEVARLRGVWCETDCWGDGPRLVQHRPHFAYGSGFTVVFARAIRTLIRRGVLVAVTFDGEPYPVFPGQRIQRVRRVKCSKQN